MFRQLKSAILTVALGACVMLGGVACDDGEFGGGFGLDAFGFGSEDALGGAGDAAGDYYYGFYDTEGTGSFSLVPGADPGDSLETYLGNSVIY